MYLLVSEILLRNVAYFSHVKLVSGSDVKTSLFLHPELLSCLSVIILGIMLTPALLFFCPDIVPEKKRKTIRKLRIIRAILFLSGIMIILVIYELKVSGET
jgi:hypothetical protein